MPLTTSLIALSGAIQGPPVALLLGRLLDIRWQDVYLRPELTHLWNCIPGAIYSVVGYLIGILPLEYFRAEIRRFPPAGCCPGQRRFGEFHNKDHLESVRRNYHQVGSSGRKTNVAEPRSDHAGFGA